MAQRQQSLVSLLAAALTTRGYVVVVPDYRLYPEVRFPDFLVEAPRLCAGPTTTSQHWAAIRSGCSSWGIRRGHTLPPCSHLIRNGSMASDSMRPRHRRIDRHIGTLRFPSAPRPDLVDIFGGANRADTQPISFAEGRKPPALLVTGDADKVVGPGNSTRLADRLRHNGNEATEVSYRRLGHITVLAGFAPLLSSDLP